MKNKEKKLKLVHEQVKKVKIQKNDYILIAQ